MTELQLSEREKRRYEKQIALAEIGEKGQLKLKSSRVLVIGAGGKGTATLETLIAAGVGAVGICDDSVIQEDILSRQSLFGDNDIGKQKAIVTKQFLETRNQFTHIKVNNIQITSENIEKIAENCDLIINATYNIETHKIVSQSGAIKKKPIILCFRNNNTPLITALTKESTQSIDDLISVLNKSSISESTSTPHAVANFLTGTLLANEAIRILLGLSSVLKSNFLMINTDTYNFSLIPTQSE